MLEILGDDYIVQHIMQEYRKEQKELIYRIYVTDALYSIATRTSVPSKRYIDIINEAQSEPMDEQTAKIKANEIKTHFLDKLNGRRERTNGFDESGSKAES